MLITTVAAQSASLACILAGLHYKKTCSNTPTSWLSPASSVSRQLHAIRVLPVCTGAWRVLFRDENFFVSFSGSFFSPFPPSQVWLPVPMDPEFALTLPVCCSSVLSVSSEGSGGLSLVTRKSYWRIPGPAQPCCPLAKRKHCELLWDWGSGTLVPRTWHPASNLGGRCHLSH